MANIAARRVLIAFGLAIAVLGGVVWTLTAVDNTGDTGPRGTRGKTGPVVTLTPKPGGHHTGPHLTPAPGKTVIVVEPAPTHTRQPHHRHGHHTSKPTPTSTPKPTHTPRPHPSPTPTRCLLLLPRLCDLTGGTHVLQPAP